MSYQPWTAAVGAGAVAVGTVVSAVLHVRWERECGVGGLSVKEMGSGSGGAGRWCRGRKARISYCTGREPKHTPCWTGF